MKINRLTAKKVDALKDPGLYADGNNLWLQIRPGAGGTVSKSWLFRYRFGGKQRAMGLGSTRWTSLAEARAAARDTLRIVKVDRIDPLEQREAAAGEKAVAARKAMTFRQAAEAYIASMREGWKNQSHAQQWPATLEAYVYPVFGDLDVALIDTTLVLKALESIWLAKPETATRVRGRIESVLAWASARGLRAGENPARWRGHLDKLLPAKTKVTKVEHHPTLAYAEIAGFMARLGEEDSVGAMALEFAVLTAARSGEVRLATWAEINFDLATWTVPGARMKMGVEHVVPLSDRALAILRDMFPQRRSDSDAIFTMGKGKPLGRAAMSRALNRTGRDDVTVHGFRSTFRVWAAEATAFPREWAEKALAHSLSDATEAAYNRSNLLDQRRKLMDAWARYCATPAAVGDNVRAIRG